MVWQDMQLGPSGSPRPDVYAINKSYAHPAPAAYECKISVADFRADVTVGKWRSYLAYAHKVVFAVPAGLVQKTEIPDMCGLMVRGDKGWRLAKAATVNPHPIAQEALLKLLIDGVAREGPPMRAKHWHDANISDKFAKKFGSTAARYVVDAASIEREIDHARRQIETMHERARKDCEDIRKLAESEAPLYWRQLLDVLGLEADSSRSIAPDCGTA